MFSFVVRVLMIADVKPRPAIKTPGAYAADVIGRKVFADFIAFIGAHPEFVTARAKCDSYGIPDSPRINLLFCAIRVKLEDARAILFASIIRNIVARTKGRVHFFVVLRENDGARPVAAAPQYSAR